MTVLGIEESERGVIFAPGYSYTRLAEIKIMYNTLMTTQYKAGASTRTSHTNTKKTHDMTHMYSKFWRRRLFHSCAARRRTPLRGDEHLSRGNEQPVAVSVVAEENTLKATYT